MPDTNEPRPLAVFLAAYNAESMEHAGELGADADGHLISATVLRRDESVTPMSPVRVRVAHGASPATAAAMLRKMADLIERSPDLLRGEAGTAARRLPDGSVSTHRLTPEGLKAAAERLGPEQRAAAIDQIERFRWQIEGEPGWPTPGV